MARCMGLDIGDKWTGVALSDPQGILASPFSIIEHVDDAQAVLAIADIVEKQGVSVVIAGLPQLMDGSEGEQAQKVRAFIQKLSDAIAVSVQFRDERLTTVTATSLMKSVNNRKNKKKERQDARAAAIILQGYLDEFRRQSAEPLQRIED